MKKITLFFVMAIALAFNSYAQPGAIDPSFSSTVSANGTVNSTLTQPDGKIILVGAFTNVNGTTSNRIARLNSDGSKDLSFAISLAAGATSGRAIKVQSNGKIIVAGEFTTVNGNPVPARIIRLNADGTLDASFNLGGVGADATILSIAIDSNDKILIGGSFTNYNGVSRNRIARLNADGTLDITFVVGTGATSNINAIEIQPTDAKIIIGGNLISYNGIPRSRIARLNTDGSLDITFIPAVANLAVRAIAIQTDGKIIYGGDFTTYAGDVNKKYAVRVDTNGALDAAYNVYGFNGSVRSLSLDANGKLLVGGAFTNYNVATTANIARLNTDASLDYTFNTTGANGAIESASIQTNGKILIGGSFTTFNGVSKIRLVRVLGYYSTQLSTTYCGATLTSLSTTLVADLLNSAQAYRFKITKVNTVTNLPIAAAVVVDRPVNNISLSNVAGTTYNSKYQIEVAVKINNVWEPYFGSPCYVNTPNPISTIGAQCNSTLTSMGEFVYATYVSAVTGYRFRVTNTTTNAFQEYDALNGQNRFTFNQLSSAIRDYGTTYFVEVALRNTDGNYLPYGTGCNITTPTFPTSEIVASQCNTVATSSTQSISAVIVSGATEYRFQLTNVGLAYSAQIDRPLSNFNLGMFSGLQSGTTYTVLVAVKIGGVWGPLTGNSCTITTPGSMLDITKVSAKNNNFVAIAYPNPFTESFMLDVVATTESTIQIRVYDMVGKQIENKNVDVNDMANLQIGAGYQTGVYNVIVSQGENAQTVRVVKR
ncbi:MAG: T9SS type A sorting domain-containing protein [Bacteroidota bacterium]